MPPCICTVLERSRIQGYVMWTDRFLVLARRKNPKLLRLTLPLTAGFGRERRKTCRISPPAAGPSSASWRAENCPAWQRCMQCLPGINHIASLMSVRKLYPPRDRLRIMFFIERPGKSVMYEKIYPKAGDSPAATRQEPGVTRHGSSQLCLIFSKSIFSWSSSAAKKWSIPRREIFTSGRAMPFWSGVDCICFQKSLPKIINMKA